MDRDLNIIQITDCHLLSDRNAIYNGINPYQQLNKIIEALINKHDPIDLIMLTGDLAEDGKIESYKHVLEIMEPAIALTHAIPGNHDNKNNMTHAFEPTFIKLEREVILDHWTILMLDSTLPNKIGGEISQETLKYIDAKAVQHKNKNILIFLHHNPISVDSGFFDKHMLCNGDEFMASIEKHKNIKAVSFGHVHQQFFAKKNGIKYYGTPSTSVQFRPFIDKIAITSDLPGYRHFTLKQDELLTNVHRVDL